MSSMDRGEGNLKENIKVDPGTEDELSVPTKLSRVTPRNSLAGNPSPTSLNPTPHANVRDTVGEFMKTTVDSLRFVVATTGGNHTKADNNTAEASFELWRTTISAARGPKYSQSITHAKFSPAITTVLWE